MAQAPVFHMVFRAGDRRVALSVRIVFVFFLTAPEAYNVMKLRPRIDLDRSRRAHDANRRASDRARHLAY